MTSSSAVGVAGVGVTKNCNIWTCYSSEAITTGLLKLKVPLLIGMLKVHDRMGALINHLARRIKLLAIVVPCVLGLAEATIHNLQLLILVCRRNCTTIEKVILTPQLCELAWGSDVALFISGHIETLLDNSFGGVVLQVEWVLLILSHSSHAGVEVQALRVRYGLKVLLPYGVSLIKN
jgi:hypothetical protein